MNYKGEWEAKGLTGATDSMHILIATDAENEDKLAGTVTFYTKDLETTKLIITLLEDSFRFVTEPPTARGYTAIFDGKALDANTIRGSLNYGINTINTTRTKEEVTFTRKAPA